jgi:hypothetical protein
MQQAADIEKLPDDPEFRPTMHARFLGSAAMLNRNAFNSFKS